MRSTEFSPWARLGGALFASLGISILLAHAVYEPALSRLLAGADNHVPPLWKSLLWLLPTGTLALALLPSALCTTVRTTRGGSVTAFVLATLALFACLADLALYATFGRHLTDLAIYATQADGVDAAGDLGSQALKLLVLLFWASAAAGVWLLAAISGGKLLGRLGALLRGTLIVSSVLLVLGLAILQPLMRPLAPDTYGPRLFASLPLRPFGPALSSEIKHSDPGLRRLEELLTQEYQGRLGYFYAPEPARTPPPATRPLKVSLIVAESLRSDALTTELMPRLTRYAKSGQRFFHHLAGTNHSETGLFALLYGKSALTYDSTLDAQTSPTLFSALSPEDGPQRMRFGYFTGHPEKWLRRQEFLNEQTLDDYSRDDSGSWNAWDENALRRAASALKNKSSYLALTFLMSSHYEYRYPAKYRIDVPDRAPKTSFLPGEIQDSERQASQNRYRNVCRYLDDLVMDHIEGLPNDVVVVFTGDHGEATGESGRFGHGFDFSRTLTEVPFFMVGPGIESGTFEGTSLHQDLLPTLVHLATGKDVSGPLYQSLLAPSGHGGVLQGYAQRGLTYSDALLQLAKLRVRLRLDPKRASLRIMGLEDENAQPRFTPLTPDDVEKLHLEFRRQLLHSPRALP